LVRKPTNWLPKRKKKELGMLQDKQISQSYTCFQKQIGWLHITEIWQKKFNTPHDSLYKMESDRCMCNVGAPSQQPKLL
jgi:hypothetical protein